VVANSPLGSVADAARSNLEAWSKLQESMLKAFLGRREDSNRGDDDAKRP
jgi:hypothetical protein